jgi:hypothetical protein
MSGDIDMDKNRLLKLPAPTDDQEVATKGYADALSKAVWKDISQSAMVDLNRTESLDFTALDLSPYTSPKAKWAIVRINLKADTIGTDPSSFLAIRKNGTTPNYYPIVVLGREGATVAVYYRFTVPIGLDSAQMIEYRIYVGTNWQVDSRIEVLGYIE